MTTKKNKKKYIFDVDSTLTPSRFKSPRDGVEFYQIFLKNVK